VSKRVILGINFNENKELHISLDIIIREWIIVTTCIDYNLIIHPILYA
jgi:hypothetical protein